MLALGALVAFLVMHVTECAMVATTDGEARATMAVSYTHLTLPTTPYV